MKNWFAYLVSAMIIGWFVYSASTVEAGFHHRHQAVGYGCSGGSLSGGCTGGAVYGSQGGRVFGTPLRTAISNHKERVQTRRASRRASYGCNGGSVGGCR